MNAQTETLDEYMAKVEPPHQEADSLKQKLIEKGVTPPTAPKFSLNSDYWPALQAHVAKLRELCASMPAKAEVKMSAKPSPFTFCGKPSPPITPTNTNWTDKCKAAKAAK